LTREDLIRHPFTPSMRLIELGASYSPIIPKAEGWQTTVIDHATQDQLREKYHGENKDRIEPVDFVWQGEPLDELLPADRLGQFDGLIASHVGEHIPDLIGFFQAIDRVLKPGGVIALALPDMRVCFDFFQARTSTGDLLDAHAQHRTRHRRGKIFDGVAYMATRGSGAGWPLNMPAPAGSVNLIHDLATAKAEYDKASDQPADPYTDSHGWQFTPSSFRLIMRELHHLDLIPWTITRLDQAGGVEFYVWLERSHIKLSAEQLQAERLDLLRRTLIETAREHLLQLGETQAASPPPATPPAATPPAPEPVAPPAPPPSAPSVTALQEVAFERILDPDALAPIGIGPRAKRPVPTISAIVPLYNGQRYIAGCLDSILDQDLPPIEIIVVDDGSRDDGAQIVEAYQAANPDASIILLREDNGGQSSARNMGAFQAKGDLLAFLDQDDRWYPAHLVQLVKPFINPPPGQPLGWVYSDLDEADGDGNIIHHNFLMTMADPQHPKRNLYRCIDRDMFVLPSASLIARSVFIAMGGFDERLSGYEDDDLFLRIFHAGFNNVFLNMALSKWCIHHDSSSFTPRMRHSRMVYCRKLLTAFPDTPERNVYLSRDTILPRFYSHARVEYHKALLAGDLLRIDETMAEMRFILGIAANADGINTYMDRKRAVKLLNQFNSKDAEAALRRHQMHHRVQPISRRIPPRLLFKMARMVPLIG